MPKPKKKENRGGYRDGAGRPEGDDELVLFNFRIPNKLRNDVKAKYPRILNKMIIEWMRGLLE